MNKLIGLVIAAILAVACGQAPADLAPTLPPMGRSAPTSPSPIPATNLPAETNQALTATPEATQALPASGYGPANFPAGIDPLTGLKVADAKLLERRPLAVKIENLPRNHRPQWGLTAADVVYEYYTEQGTTRFAAIFYGKDAERVGPIRSARFFDVNIVRMYKAVFAFGSAYQAVLDRLRNSEFADRLVIEGGNNCPPMCRFEPNGQNILVTNTAQLSQYATKLGVSNGNQNLDGMFFQTQAPTGGKAADQVFVRFSGAIYNRWDFDAKTGRYFRWVDKQDDINNKNEVYTQLADKLTNQPVTAENVVILYMPYLYVVKTADTEVFDVDFIGSGQGYVARDGQIYSVTWKRSSPDDVVSLVSADPVNNNGVNGKPFALKPGITWYEVLHSQSQMAQQGATWRFTFVLPE